MENTPIEAAGVAPAPQTETQPINTQPMAPAVDMHGFTSEQLADMRRFYDANGGYDRVKSRISNPEPVAQPQPQYEQPQYQEPQYQEPAYGSIRPDEFLAQQYFMSLSGEEKYKGISEEISSGRVLRDMAEFNIRPFNNDGSINDHMIRKYLDLKSQTVASHQTSSAPVGGIAPTVDYVPYSEQMTDIRQAMAVLQQDSQLKAQGLAGHPSAGMAEDFMRSQLNHNSGK